MNIDQAFTLIFGEEGGYANRNPIDDPGGETMWGITARVARAHGYTGAMVDLPQETAKAIYRSDYWDAVHCDSLPEALRFDVFDAAVNSGPQTAVKWLQAAVGSDPDGIVGPHTLACAAAAPVETVRRRLTGARLHFMVGCPNWAANSRGWAQRIADLLLTD